MVDKPVIRLLHHMARSGGTIVSRCLGCMDSVVLLSEIHPWGGRWFDPLDQARQWFDFVTEEEVRQLRGTPGFDFGAAIQFLERRCNERNQHLVLRDWSHLDFTGVPFVTTPSYRLLTAESLKPCMEVVQAITVRHPLDQFQSLMELKNTQGRLTVSAFLAGYRRFAQCAAGLGFLRYEDFVDDPDKVLRELCQRLRLPFDASYKDRWMTYDKITGIRSRDDDTAIRRPPPRPIDSRLLYEIEQNEDYFASLELLGYEHPAFLDTPSRLMKTLPPQDRTEELNSLMERGNQLADQRKWAEAARLYEQALILAPRHEWALNNLGYCLLQLGQLDLAILYLQRSLAIKRDLRLALVNLITALERAERKFEAIPYLRRLTELDPQIGEHAFKLANLLTAAGRVHESLFYYRRALQCNPESQVTVSNYLLALNYVDDLSVEFIAQEHFRWTKRWPCPPGDANGFAQSRDPNRRLRIGYLSGDFFTHPDGKTMPPIMAAHDRAQCEVFAYSDGNREDDWTQRARESCDTFRPTAQMTDEQLLDQIRNDQIDVLIELRGHMGGRNRFGVLARRAAPIQVAFLGYPNTSGLPAIDYRITDRFCDPPGQTEHLHSEKLIRLTRGFLCFQPPIELPPLDPDPAERNGFITFGSFNNPTKITPLVLDCWARILEKVPHSRLVVKYLNKFANQWLREQWRGSFAAAGIDPRRIEFFAAVPTLEGHWKLIGSVDIALDPFPYQGTHTTLESLAMGVPVLTMMGETYTRRASSALLLRLGLEDLVTTCPDQYVDRAIALATDPGRRLRLRTGLRDKFLASDICDVLRYTCELEEVYRNVWAEWCMRSD